MNSFSQSIKNVFEGAAKAFQTFPAAILCALAFAVVTIIRIQLEWPEQEQYNFLFNCLHWAFAFGAVFGLAAITVAQSSYGDKKTFLLANILGAAAAVFAFLMLYNYGEADSDYAVRYTSVSTLATARVSAAILISFLIFILIASFPRERSDFARSFFMTHKAFFIALLYGIVIMAGLSGVAGAVEALLYRDMSEKVYMYIGTLTGFLAFTIFLGYFPDFRRGTIDDHRETAQKQPRFIEILFGYIMIPIVLALTLVLLIWSGRTVLTGTWPLFGLLSGIATAYSFGGLWLHIMVTHHESGPAKFYRRFYPLAALIILAFEAAALITQIGKSGLKLTEYYFALTWIIAVAGVVLLILFKSRAHQSIVIVTCAAALIAVLPLVGYYALPVSSQTDRLEKLLISEQMLENDKLDPAPKEPELSVRQSITDAVYYLANAEEAKLPVWFDEDLKDSEVFQAKLGFEPVWPEPDDYGNGSGEFLGTSLYLQSGAVDVSGYQWSILFEEGPAKENKPVTVKGNAGEYDIDWRIDSPDGIPSLKVTLEGSTVLEEDLNGYVERITSQYPPGGMSLPKAAALKDMSYVIQNEQIEVLLIFNNVEINADPQRDQINYWLNLKALYFNEKY